MQRKPCTKSTILSLTFSGVVPVRYWRPGNLLAPALEAFARMPYSEVERLTSFCQDFCQRGFLPRIRLARIAARSTSETG
jgi:hypothetical protein